jgi:hypothetical protein
VLATGISPEELENSESVGVTVAMPIDKVNTHNLTALIDSKAGLIKKALGIAELDISVDEDKVSFPWFSAEIEPETLQTYTRFIAALCEMSVKQKRIQAEDKAVENEKYAFRCFLLRLGFIGAKYKADRRVLLKNLEGSAAFKKCAKGGEQ